MRRTWKCPPAALLALALPALAATAGCKSAPANDPVLKLSAEESLAAGKELLAREKHARARPYFEHAFEAEPNSVTGRTALLLVADTYYLEGNTSNFVQAEAKYRDYLNRFPTSEQAAYVQFQIANSLAKRMEKPDRDQSTTRKAVEAYQDLLRLYPTSEYAAQAREQMEVVRANLAEHEFVVGRFYLRYGRPVGAVERFRFLLDTYPEYPERDKVMYHLGLAYRESDQQNASRETFERLKNEFPDSPYNDRVPEATQKASR
ncbi:MAG TPA: outer membrane protein assembly factor BamD [Thermoanaerobaculia bacterium]|nr:outer membrane protein assembly factor BamD [Thermoanaerobaculia bacterium]